MIPQLLLCESWTLTISADQDGKVSLIQPDENMKEGTYAWMDSVMVPIWLIYLSAFNLMQREPPSSPSRAKRCKTSSRWQS